MASAQPLLKLTDIAKSFGAVQALRGVSFDLHAGEVHALLGENGAGKSTLIKVITGAHAPDSGSIVLAGEELKALDPRTAHIRGITCIYQQPSLFPDLSVAENVALRLGTPRCFECVNIPRQQKRAQELLGTIGAEIDPAREIRELSMPEQQLVEIACAIGSGARVVIMDEPTASLTQKEQHLLYAVVRKLRASGAGVIYISHRLEEIFALADRVTVLRDGQSVGTNLLDSLNESALIAMMVGREAPSLHTPSERTGGEVVLSLRDVGCAAGGVKHVSLDLRAGEVVGLAGLIGAGRTEIARVIFGITPATEGQIVIDGSAVVIDAPRTAIANGIAYVPEDRRRHGIILEMPIAQNITMATHEQTFPGGWLRAGAESHVATEFMGRLGIKASGPNAPGAALSGGNQQKVAVARWLAAKPRVLILDEPTQGVDVGAKAEIHRIVRELASEGMAVLLISSDLPEVIAMSDRIAVVRGGTVATVLEKGVDAERVMAVALGKEEG